MANALTGSPSLRASRSSLSSAKTLRAEVIISADWFSTDHDARTAWEPGSIRTSFLRRSAITSSM